jgi:UDP-glucose:(heptosyl)LPS alpha-1,3-glucosyltransferase
MRVLCLESNPAFEDGLTIERLPVPRWPRWRRELGLARAALERRRSGGADVTLAVRHALEADVYQPHGGPFRTAVRESLSGVKPALFRRTKLLLRLLRPATRSLLWLDREILLRSRGLVLVSLSRKVEEEFRSAYPGVSFRFERIYNGVDLDEFHDRDRTDSERALRERFAIPEGRPVALFVGHKFGPKGLADAVSALARAPAFHLVVLGSGRKSAFESLARSLGMEGRIHFAGPSAAPRAFYAGSQLLVHPTYYDPCSLSVLESLACGTPVITTTANGAAELLESGREGYVIPPGDPPALARAAEAIAADWHAFHARALDRSKALSFHHHLDAMERVLLRAAEERRKASS